MHLAHSLGLKISCCPVFEFKGPNNASPRMLPHNFVSLIIVTKSYRQHNDNRLAVRHVEPQQNTAESPPSLLLLLLLIQRHAQRRNHGQIHHRRHSHKVLNPNPHEPISPLPFISRERKGGGKKLTVSLSAKISRMLKMLREMCATGSPPKVTLAERSYQVPRTSSSTCRPSDSFLKATVDSLARTVAVRGEEWGRVGREGKGREGKGREGKGNEGMVLRG